MHENAGLPLNPFKRIKPFPVFQQRLDEYNEIQAEIAYEASLTDPFIDATEIPNADSTTTDSTTVDSTTTDINLL